MSNECTLENMTNKSINELCAISKNCEYDYINLNELHYCVLQGKIYFSLPIFLIIGLVCFYLLSDTANKYLSQALTNISDKLGLSQNLAGVTFLALGNGAPDVIASIVASEGQDDEGLDVAIGALLGGGIFVSCLVFSMVILFAKRIKLNRNMFLRDLLLYIFMMIFMIFIGIHKRMGLIAIISIFMAYFIYVIIAIIQDRLQKKPSLMNNSSHISINYSKEDPELDQGLLNPEEYLKKKIESDRVVEYIFNELEQDEGIFIVHYDNIFSNKDTNDLSQNSIEKFIQKDSEEINNDQISKNDFDHKLIENTTNNINSNLTNDNNSL